MPPPHLLIAENLFYWIILVKFFVEKTFFSHY
jgi:hypothetical protein